MMHCVKLARVIYDLSRIWKGRKNEKGHSPREGSSAYYIVQDNAVLATKERTVAAVAPMARIDPLSLSRARRAIRLLESCAIHIGIHTMRCVPASIPATFSDDM